MIDTAVVILNWNGVEYLERFLPSVVAGTCGRAAVWVADNASTDGSVELVGERFPTVGVIRLDRNYGFAGGYNRALAYPGLADARYVVILNSDVETPEGWLNPLLQALDADPGLAAVSPKILSYRKRNEFEYAGASGGFIDLLGYPFCRGRILSTVETDRGQYDDPRTVFWATGACMAVRAEVFRSLGGLDADFFAHMEEIDFCWRAALAGWRVAVEPASYVYHLGGGTLSAGDPRKIYLNYRNGLYMLRKNLPRKSRRWILPARMLADGLSALVYLFTFRFAAFRAVWKAHRDYRQGKRMMDCKRESFAKEAGPLRPPGSMAGVYRGSIVVRYLLGKRRFGKIL